MTFGNGSFIRCWPADQDPGEAKSADDWNSRAQQSPGHSRSIVSMDVLLFRSNMLVELIRYIMMYALQRNFRTFRKVTVFPRSYFKYKKSCLSAFWSFGADAAAGYRCCRVLLQGAAAGPAGCCCQSAVCALRLGPRKSIWVLLTNIFWLFVVWAGVTKGAFYFQYHIIRSAHVLLQQRRSWETCWSLCCRWTARALLRGWCASKFCRFFLGVLNWGLQSKLRDA